MFFPRAILLLVFAFFFTGVAGCRSTVRVGDFAVVSEFQILQSIAIEAQPIDSISSKTSAPVDLPER